MLAGTAFAMLGMIAGDILGTPRMLFAFARDGLLPRVLGRVHPVTGTPRIAILVYAALAIILALTGSFTELAVLATLASAGLYVAACIAAWLLARKEVALAGAPLDFRWLGPRGGCRNPARGCPRQAPSAPSYSSRLAPVAADGIALRITGPSPSFPSSPTADTSVAHSCPAPTCHTS
ncbi:MAG: amino acid permease [Steroidobacteraceae bacterium]